MIFKEHGKSFLDEITSIFHHFYSAFTEANETIVMEGEKSPTLNLYERFVTFAVFH